MAVPAESDLTHPALLLRLADGELHSGADLAVDLGVSRAALWKSVARLRADGVPVLSPARRGYRLAQATELFDAARIRAALDPALAAHVRRLDVHYRVDSTNTRLLAQPPPPFATADVCLGEIQTAGRGRRGRRWLAGFGDGITLSVAWNFPAAVRDLPALSLAVGVAVATAARRLGAGGIRLKWPNDIWFADRKLGGVLIELRAEGGGPTFAVIGIGLNVRMTLPQRREIEAGGARVAALADTGAVAVGGPRAPPRNDMVGVLLDELLRMLLRFEREGFSPYRSVWSGLDALRDQPAQVLLGNQTILGIARGVDENGALLLEVDGCRRTFVSGEASLRPGKDMDTVLS